SAARPAAEAAARAVSEEMMGGALASAHQQASGSMHETEERAIAAAEKAAQAIAKQAVEEVHALRSAATPDVDNRLQEALAGVGATAQRVAQEAVATHRTALDDSARQLLESAHAELRDRARDAAHEAAKPVAETAARAAAEDALRSAFALRDEGDTALR